MNLAYAFLFDPEICRDAFSGVGYAIFSSIQRHAGHLEKVYPDDTSYSWSEQLGFRWEKLLSRKKVLMDRFPSRMKRMSRQVDDKLQRMKCDAVLSPNNDVVAYLNYAGPLFLWNDYVFAGMLDRFEWHSGLSGRTILAGIQADRQTLEKCRTAIFSNHWAAQCAIAEYGVPKEKVEVVPYGANQESGLSRKHIESLIAKRSTEEIRLCLVGGDWQRKGCAKAVEVAKELFKRGRRVRLQIVGARPPLSFVLPEFVECLGWFGKGTESKKLWDRLYGEAHFLVLPSEMECCAVSLADANSYGVPALANDVGGNSTSVLNDVSGHLFSVDAEPSEYADYIERVYDSQDEYFKLCRSSYDRYASELNWDVAAGRVLAIIQQEVSSR
jgi:glycosyltransferase involved in cell wall biosynthesis